MNTDRDPISRLGRAKARTPEPSPIVDPRAAIGVSASDSFGPLEAALLSAGWLGGFGAALAMPGPDPWSLALAFPAGVMLAVATTAIVRSRRRRPLTVNEIRAAEGLPPIGTSWPPFSPVDRYGEQDESRFKIPTVHLEVSGTSDQLVDGVRGAIDALLNTQAQTVGRLDDARRRMIDGQPVDAAERVAVLTDDLTWVLRKYEAADPIRKPFYASWHDSVVDLLEDARAAYEDEQTEAQEAI